ASAPRVTAAPTASAARPATSAAWAIRTVLRRKTTTASAVTSSVMTARGLRTGPKPIASGGKASSAIPTARTATMRIVPKAASPSASSVVAAVSAALAAPRVKASDSRAPARTRTCARVTSGGKSLYLDYGKAPPEQRQFRQLRRREHQGPQGPRRGAQAARHVHRRHRRRLGPPPHGVRG